jgi:hypothetical protein
MIIYIDDILVYSKIVEKHVEDLKYVFEQVLTKKLFVNRSKNEFY